MIEYKLHSEYLEMNEWEYVYAKHSSIKQTVKTI